MHLVYKNIKKYPITSCFIALIWILSLAPVFPETPLDDVEFIDKWVHVAMYGGTFTILWIEYAYQHKSYDYEKLFFWAWLAPIMMSGVLELLQEYCTGGHRSGGLLHLQRPAPHVDSHDRCKRPLQRRVPALRWRHGPLCCRCMLPEREPEHCSG